MKLILAKNGNVEYDISDELLELEVEVMLDRLMEALSEKQVNDSELLQALMNSPWEQEMRAYGT